MAKYEELAARRFRRYKWEVRKAAFDQELMAIAMRMAQQTIPVLEQLGLTRKRIIEKVSVE